MQRIKEILKPLLRRMGLYDIVRSLYHFLWNLTHGTPKQRRRAFFRSFDTFVSGVKLRARTDPTVIFFGYLQDSRKPLLFRVAQTLSRQTGVLLCTNTSARGGDEAAAELLGAFDAGQVLHLPVKSSVDSRLTIPVTKEMQALLEGKPYLRDALINARESFPQAGEGYVETLILQYYRCFGTLLDCVNVSTMVIWNAFKYHHGILAAMCREREIPVLFAEFGVIPGTVVFDRQGQMGESWPATQPDAFHALPVSDEECTEAQKVLGVLRRSGLNRNAQQSETGLDQLTARLKPDRPTLLFAGQCDRDSGMIPYNENARRHHSPCFPSTVDAVVHVAAIAAANDWNLVFRPHPVSQREAQDHRLPENVISCTDGSINDIIDLADVVVTTLSSTVYISLIRETPCVMLGYNQIHGKHCAYEALDVASIEPVLQQAVTNSYTAEQKAAFIRHTAQMGKYYLYADGRRNGTRSFGRSEEDAVALIAELASMTHRSIPQNERDLVSEVR